MQSTFSAIALSIPKMVRTRRQRDHGYMQRIFPSFHISAIKLSRFLPSTWARAFTELRFYAVIYFYCQVLPIFSATVIGHLEFRICGYIYGVSFPLLLRMYTLHYPCNYKTLGLSVKKAEFWACVVFHIGRLLLRND